MRDWHTGHDELDGVGWLEAFAIGIMTAWIYASLAYDAARGVLAWLLQH